MADIVGIFAASHAPPLVRNWDTIQQGRKQRLDSAFLEMGRKIATLRPDVIVAVGADHWANFFLNNMPAICIGVGKEHGGPPEAWLTEYQPQTMEGNPSLGLHLSEYAFGHGFEPSLSHHLRLDHAFCIPILRAKINPLPAIVPIIINCIQEPATSIARCLAFGELLSNAIRSFDAPARVLILATGGLSHSVGEPIMGDIDEAFDRECIRLFTKGDSAALVNYLSDERLARAGNGSSEVRYWLVAHGAAARQGFELMHYEVVPETFTGCGFAEWRLGA